MKENHQDDIALVDQGTPVQTLPQAQQTAPQVAPARLAVDQHGNPLLSAQQHHGIFVKIMLAIILTFAANTGIALWYNETVIKPREAAMAVRQQEIVEAARQSQLQAQALIDVLTSKSRALKTAVSNELGALGFQATK